MFLNLGREEIGYQVNFRFKGLKDHLISIQLASLIIDDFPILNAELLPSVPDV